MRCLPIAVVAAGWLSAFATGARADVIVLQNLAPQQVTFQVSHVAAAAKQQTLGAGQLATVPTVGKATIEFSDAAGRTRRVLDANSAHQFDVTSAGELVLEPLDFGGNERTAAGTGRATAKNYQTIGELPIKVLVDDEEPAARRAWQQRIERRVSMASAVLEKYCLLRLKIVAVGEWRTSNDAADFEQTLDEFTRTVPVAPARLAIGFTSQHAVPAGPAHVGSACVPLGTHILLREWSEQLSEPERAEALLHELGHFLGASHVENSASVMRPWLGDGQARRADFPHVFDAGNALVIYLIAEEIRLGRAIQAADFSAGSVARLRQIYGVIGKPLAEPALVLAPPSPGESHPPPPPPATDLPPDEAPSPPPAAGEQPVVRTPVVSDVDKLVGTWAPVSALHNGGPLGEVQTVTFLRDRVLVTTPDGTVHTFTYRLTPDREVKQFDLALQIRGRQVVSQGIYRFDGDKLIACNALPGRPRPNQWTSTAEDGQALIVFRRVK